ncbi:MAG: TetR family transcriptional regulator [Eubacterium sp.]|nr:TetR family transcriptional regulator [Eubacterium sp.]
MKRKTAKEILTDSFQELAAEKSIDKITIQEIVDNCGYSPATFYRHFKDKYDLIAWEHTRAIAKIVDKTVADDYQWKQTLYDGARLYNENKEYLVNLLQHTSGHDSFMQYMTEINCAALEKYILSVKGDQKLTHDEMMYVKLYCYGLVGLACEWMLGQIDATLEEIAEVYERSIPEPLKKYLL